MTDRTIKQRLKDAVSLDTPEDSDAIDTTADIAAGFIPGVGTVQSARDLERARRDKDWAGMGLAAVGLIPEARGVIKTGEKVIKNIADHTHEFKTAKGSTYKHYPDSTTVRDKAARPEHPGEEGIQPRSTKTIYMDERGVQATGSWLQDKNLPTKMVPEFDDAGKPTGHVLVKYMDDTYNPVTGKLLGKKDQIVSRVPYKTTPEVGLSPVEIYNHAESPIGSKARNVHFGNKIVETRPVNKTTDLPKNYREGGRVRMI